MKAAPADAALGIVVPLDEVAAYVARGWTVEASFDDRLSALVLPPMHVRRGLGRRREPASGSPKIIIPNRTH